MVGASPPVQSGHFRSPNKLSVSISRAVLERRLLQGCFQVQRLMFHLPLLKTLFLFCRIIPAGLFFIAGYQDLWFFSCDFSASIYLLFATSICRGSVGLMWSGEKQNSNMVPLIRDITDMIRQYRKMEKNRCGLELGECSLSFPRIAKE